MPLCTTCLLLVPLVTAAAPAADVAPRVDAVVAELWKHQDVAPQTDVEDAVFLRRVWLDLAGRVPSVDETTSFLADRATDRRARLVDRLLASPEFADHWGRTWAEWLIGNRPLAMVTYDGRVLRAYLRDALRDGKSYRQVVRELIAGEGISDRSGPANFLLRYEGKPINLAGAVGKQFLGITLQCAQCHNHPYARWKEDDFWGVAGLFGRLRVFDSGGDGGLEPLRAVMEGKRGELQVPDLKAKLDADGNRPLKIIEPRLPGGTEVVKGGRRREVLADWITGEKNPYFPRHAVNRVWGELLGNRLETSLDFLEEEDASKPQHRLLDLLAEDFVANGYDLKHLVRVVVLSKPYRLASGSPTVVGEQREEQLRNFARFTVRPLSPDQLLASVTQATGYSGVAQEPAEAQPADKPEPGDTVLDRPDDLAVDVFGERARTLQRSLALMNGDHVHKAVAAAAAALLPEGKKVGPADIEHLVLATLCRQPTADEKTALLKLAKSGTGAEGLEDVLWALLNSAEFNTIH